MLCFTHGKNAPEQLIPMKTLSLDYHQQYLPSGSFQLFVSIFYTCTQCFYFHMTVHLNNFHSSHLFWARASYMLPEYFGLYLQIHRNIVLHTMLQKPVHSPKGTTDFRGVAHVTAKYISGPEYLVSFLILLCADRIQKFRGSPVCEQCE